MADIQHSTLTDPQLHEPKGVSTALAEQAYIANGLGSGTWNYPYYTLTCEFPDISAPTSIWVTAPFTGNIVAYYTVLHGAITVANTTCTLEIGGVLVTNSSLTIAFSGSGAGTVDSATPTALNTVNQGQAIEVITDGASSTTAKATVTLVIQRTA